MYNCIYNNIVLNRKPLTLKQAEEFVSSTIMNYGYKPEIIRV